MAANTDPDANTITFNIPGAGTHTIQPGTALPAITQSVTIDGYTQPGASPNTLAVGNNAVLAIEIDGTGVAGDGLRITGNDVTVRGLVLNRFTAGFTAAIDIVGGSFNAVEGNFLGTDAAGTTLLSNKQGVLIQGGGSSNRVGTDGDGSGDAGERNVVAGTSVGGGIAIVGSDSNVIAGNYLGTNRDGSALLGQLGDDINLGGRFNRVGTDGDGLSDALERNVIAGAKYAGVTLYGALSENAVAGNYIGLNAAGTAPLANGYGVTFGYTGGAGTGATWNRIGTNGDGVGDAAERNIISGNGIGIWFGLVGGVGIEQNVVAGNFIGTNPAGTAAIPNAVGVVITEGRAGTSSAATATA